MLKNISLSFVCLTVHAYLWLFIWQAIVRGPVFPHWALFLQATIPRYNFLCSITQKLAEQKIKTVVNRSRSHSTIIFIATKP
jgi:hypothetical protein